MEDESYGEDQHHRPVERELWQTSHHSDWSRIHVLLQVGWRA